MKLIISPVPGHVPSETSLVALGTPETHAHAVQTRSKKLVQDGMECGYWTTFHVSHSLRQHDHCLSFVHKITVPIFRALPSFCSCLARRQGTIKLVWYPKGDVKQVPAAKVMTCARALMLFCWQVISVGAQVLRAMVANMGPMMASGDATRDHQGKWRYVEICGGSNQRPWYLQDPWWPEGPKKNGWKRLEIERQNLRMLKDLRFSTRFHHPWGSHTQSRQSQPHVPPFWLSYNCGRVVHEHCQEGAEKIHRRPNPDGAIGHGTLRQLFGRKPERGPAVGIRLSHARCFIVLQPTSTTPHLCK